MRLNNDAHQRSRYYEERLAELLERQAELKRRSRMLLASEIATFVLFVVLAVLYTLFRNQVWLLVSAPLMLVAYVAVRRMDEHNDNAIDRLKALTQVYRNELAYLSGDFSCFRDGRDYADPSEPFAYDLDVFGPQSLFNRICRTLTTGGSRCLAASLSRLTMTKAQIEARADAIDELAEMEKWRTEYTASGGKELTDTEAVSQSLKALLDVSLPKAAQSRAVCCIAGLSVAGLVIAILASALSDVPASVPMVWAIAQLMACFLFANGALKRAGQSLDAAHRHVMEIGRMVRKIAELKSLDVKSAELQQIVSSHSEAETLFQEIERTVKGYDRRGTLMLVVFDMLWMSDFFLLFRTARLQHRLATGSELWMESLCRMDALVSMATFRYNEPEAVRAVVEDGDGVDYEARGLYHPFLGQKAVRNDFTVKDGHYYIVTGANMAGKSTFLRSVGVNYILAMNGMPVFADSLRVSRFSLFSSMRTTDDLAHGISYFNAELLRLRQLIEYCRRQHRTLIILDEILKGTNSLDKLNGSRLFLEYISQMSVSGIIATHDLELSRMEDAFPDRFHNWCFEIELADSVTYSYLITPGVARNQNATFLLKSMLGGIGEEETGGKN